MNRKIKKLFTNVRVIILLISLVLAVTAIHPNPWAEGVAIRSVTLNSSANIADISNPQPNTQPMSRERVIAIDNAPIKNLNDYYGATLKLEPNTTLQIKTNKGLYKLTTRTGIIELNETKKEGSEYLAERNLIVLRQDTKGRIRIGGVLTQVEEGGFKLEKKAAELAVLDKCIRLQG